MQALIDHITILIQPAIALGQAAWRYLDGKKTYISAGIATVIALNESAQILTGQALLSPQWEQVVLMLGVAFGVTGVAHKYDKTRNAMLAVADAVRFSQALQSPAQVVPQPVFTGTAVVVDATDSVPGPDYYDPEAANEPAGPAS